MIRPRHLASLLVLVAALLSAERARASDEEAIAGVSAVVGLAAVDLSFAVRAAVLADNHGDSQFEYSLAQSIVTVPQAVGFNIAIAALQHDNDGPEVLAALHVPATLTTALAVHGLWSLAVPDEDQAFLFLASTVIGVNTMWTSWVLGTATASRNRYGDGAAIAGIYEVITTVPGIAIGVHQALETDRFHEGWIGMAGWSGALALHGALFAAEIVTPGDDEHDYARALPVKGLGIAPTSLGSPVEGAPQTPGLVVSGIF